MKHPRLTRLALDAILSYHRLLRKLARWLFDQTLPPHWTARAYRRLYASQFEINDAV